MLSWLFDLLKGKESKYTKVMIWNPTIKAYFPIDYDDVHYDVDKDVIYIHPK